MTIKEYKRPMDSSYTYAAKVLEEVHAKQNWWITQKKYLNIMINSDEVQTWEN